MKIPPIKISPNPPHTQKNIKTLSELNIGEGGTIVKIRIPQKQTRQQIAKMCILPGRNVYVTNKNSTIDLFLLYDEGLEVSKVKHGLERRLTSQIDVAVDKKIKFTTGTWKEYVEEFFNKILSKYFSNKKL